MEDMMNEDNLLYKRFGKLKVIDKIKGFIGNEKYKRTLWVCECDCGKKIKARTISLKRKKLSTKSCGCMRGHCNKKDFGYSASKRAYHDKKKSAIKHGYIFLLKFEEFIKITKQNCSYCGDQPYQKKIFKNFNNGNFYIGNGIDRIDSDIGYVYNNCVPCCTKCNRAKNDMNVENFKKHIKEIYTNFVCS